MTACRPTPAFLTASATVALAALTPSLATAQLSKGEVRALQRTVLDALSDAALAPGRKALDRLNGWDDGSAAIAVTDLHRILDRQIVRLDEERIKLHEKVSAHFDRTGRPARGPWRKSEELRRQTEVGRVFTERLRNLAQSMNSEGALESFAENVLDNEKHALSLRLLIAAKLVKSWRGEMVDRLSKVGRDGAPGSTSRIVAAVGLERLGHMARPAEGLLLTMLNDPDQRVRWTAAAATARVGTTQAIPALLNMLERERGAGRRHAADALEILTGQTYGTYVSSWKLWAEAEAGSLEDSDLGKGKPSSSKKSKKSKRGTENEPRTSSYLGIPLDGNGIVFILDTSNSMLAKIKAKGTLGDSKETRIEACRRELTRAIRSLSDQQFFNVVWFNEASLAFQRQLVPGTEKHREAACQWLEKAPLGTGTNMHDALHHVVRGMEGPSPTGGSWRTQVDTVYLVTDGEPWAFHKQVDPVVLTRALEDWDPLHLVRVHCISVGPPLKKGVLQVMKKIAKATGGFFRQL